MKRVKILIIEDESDIVELMEYNLSREGYTILCVKDGEEGMRRARKEKPDLAVLDIMLPGVDGLEVCRQLKADPLTRTMPIVFVTAKDDESDIILGLGMGADDYIVKPFSPKELVARVKAVLRRGPLKEETETTRKVVRNGIVIDSDRHEVMVDGHRIIFTATEFRLLHFLASHPGRVFTRDQLLNRVIGDDAIITERNIDVHIRSIRKKLGACREAIETIRRVGYRFQASEN